MSNKISNTLAGILLIFVFSISVFSIREDSLTMDELAHLPAGYSYLTQRDMRLNPEHPPLIKDFAAFPLIFIKNINFPSEIKDWKDDVNGQWGFGNKFLFKSKNPADKIIFWGRIPMIFLLAAVGWFIFWWSKRIFGPKSALLALFLFSFSPTFLTHGRLVTTDVGAAAGVLFSTFYFLKFLENPSKKNLIIAGLFLGLAELAKFSLILLLPFFLIIIFVKSIVLAGNFRNFLKTFAIFIGSFILILTIAYSLIWLVYLYHTWDYPGQKQAQDTAFVLSSFDKPFLVKTTVWLADKPALKAPAQYLLGLWMVLQRASGGHTTYFAGEVSAAGWKTYFPTVYAIKEPLAFHILLIISVLYTAWLIKKPFWQKTLSRLKAWTKAHFGEFSMLVFIAIYWLVSLKSNLNIGVRHLLPVFPFTIMLVAYVISKIINPPWQKIKIALLSALLIWQAVSVISIYPHFIAYFNEIAGGPDKGYIYTTDSNLDWGQDLKRLAKWLDKKDIDKVYLDYFGGADAEFYLKEKLLPWWGTRDPKEMPKGSYFAVSASFLQGGRGKPSPGFDQPHSYYRWLDSYEPVAKIGYSIFIYYIN